MSPVPGRGQPSMWGASSGGSTPSFESSPATLTWISTSGAGFCSSRRSADSDAIEWISRTFGAMSFSFRLWRAPMKSHVNRSRCSSCFARRSWARFSPTSWMPASASAGRSPASTYFVAASTSTSGPIRSLTRSRLRRTVSASIEHDHPRLAPGDPVVAAVGEVEGGGGARAAGEMLDLGDPGGGEPRVDHPTQVEHAAVGGAPHVLELGEDLRADLVAAAADARPDGGGRRALEPVHGLLDDAAREGAPAAVEYGRLVAVREGDGEAVGDQHEEAESPLGGEVAVHARELLAAGLGVDVLRIGTVPLAEVRPVDLPAHHDPLGLHAGALSEPAPVRGDVPGLVVGEDAEVERAVGAAGDAAVAGGEDGPGAGQRKLVEELAHRASPRASASAVSSSSSRPSTRPSSFRRSVSSSARPIAGPSGTPAASRSWPPISSPTELSDVAQRSTGSDGAPSARASASASGGSPPSSARSSEGVCSLSRNAVHSRGAARAARATASRSRASSGSADTQRSSSCGLPTTIAASSEVMRFAPRVTAPSAADATCSGSGSSSGCSAVWISSSLSLRTAAGASVSSR